MTLSAFHCSRAQTKSHPADSAQPGIIVRILQTLAVCSQENPSSQSQRDAANERLIPALLRSIADVHGRRYLQLGLLKLASDALNFSGPLLLNALLHYLSHTSAPSSQKKALAPEVLRNFSNSSQPSSNGTNPPLCTPGGASQMPSRISLHWEVGSSSSWLDLARTLLPGIFGGSSTQSSMQPGVGYALVAAIAAVTVLKVPRLPLSGPLSGCVVGLGYGITMTHCTSITLVTWVQASEAVFSCRTHGHQLHQSEGKALCSCCDTLHFK